MDHLSKPDYEFEGFRLDLTLQILVCPTGEPIPLPYRSFATLRYLIERSGEIVEKSALMNEVWPKTVVAENNLNQCIRTLRKVLGESAGERRFILTVPGRGFKFVAPVRVVPHEPRRPQSEARRVMSQEAATATAPEAPEESRSIRAAPGTSKGRQWQWLMVLGGACAVLAASSVYWLLSAKHNELASPAEYLPLTDVVDSATAPVLSPDGRMLAFIRNGTWMLGSGQIWVRALPDGEYRQLTNAAGPLYAPAFTPDGTRVTYTLVDQHFNSWDTWTVPVTGGVPTKLLPNASGLTYIGPHEVMFSEFKTGIHLGIVTATDDRSDHRDVYWPMHERAMAHFSYLSPDRRSVLVVEMDGTGEFQQCRLVPFDGSSGAVAVGPAGACLSASWSSDGSWMFFAVKVAGHSHLWRQRFPRGVPQQISFGPTEEETVFAATDGHSVLTSIGTEQDTLWLHTASGERALTTEGRSYAPWLSTDARHIYFLSADNHTKNGNLSRIDIAAGSHETLLREFNVMEYDVAPDEQQVVFTEFQDGIYRIWLAPLDRHAPPKLLVLGGDQPKFGGGKVFFRSLGKQANYLHSVDLDGTNDTQLLPSPIIGFLDVAPDGKFVTVDTPVSGGLAAAWLISLQDRGEHLIGKGWFPSRWSRDGKTLLVDVGSELHATTAGRTALVSLNPDGLPSEPILPVGPGTRIIPRPEDSLSVASDPSDYAYVESEMRRNIYRIPLH